MAGKRGRGEGSIWQGANGRWYAAVTVYDRQGRPHRQSWSRKTQREVKTLRDAALADQRRGLPPSRDTERVDAYLAWWLDVVAAPRVRPITLVSYESAIRNHVVPALGRYTLAGLRQQHVRAMLSALEGKGLTPGSVSYAHRILRAALADAVRLDLVARNVAALVPSPVRKSAEIVPWTAEEARAFLSSIKGHRMEALFGVALALGLRRGEALGLRWEDVDLAAGELTVAQTLTRVRNQLILGEPKTAHSQRTIAVPRVTLALLREHRRRQLAERLAAGNRWHDSGLVFCDVGGGPFSPPRLRWLFDHLIEAAGVRRIRVHDLRHSAASLMLAQGVPLEVVSRVLGHSSTRLTGDIYAHIYREQMHDAASRMDAMLGAE